MKKQILTNLRQNQFIDLVKFTPIVLIFSLPFIFLLKSDMDIVSIVLTLVSGIISLLFVYKYLKMALIMVFPSKSKLFERYGGLKNLVNVIGETESSIEYEVKDIIASKKFILDREDYRKLICLDDVLLIYKVKQKTNGFIDFYYLEITDKYGYHVQYKFFRNEWMEFHTLFMHLQKRKGIRFGYSKENQDYVIKNIVKLADNGTQESNVDYYCPDCKNLIEFHDECCSECGCKINWNE